MPVPVYECVGADFKNKMLHYEMKNLVETEIDLEAAVSDYQELRESVDKCINVKASLPIIFDAQGKIDNQATDEQAKTALRFYKQTADQELAKIKSFIEQKEAEKLASQGDALALELLGPDGPPMSGIDDLPPPPPPAQPPEQ